MSYHRLGQSSCICVRLFQSQCNRIAPSLREHSYTTLDRPSVNKYWGTGSKRPPALLRQGCLYKFNKRPDCPLSVRLATVGKRNFPCEYNQYFVIQRIMRTFANEHKTSSHPQRRSAAENRHGKTENSHRQEPQARTRCARRPGLKPAQTDRQLTHIFRSTAMPVP